MREIASSQTLKLVTDLPAVHAKFGQDKYRTRIGFGLHFGWSVEGPVGSATKRFYDASTGRLLAGWEKGDFFSTFLEAPDLESRCHSVSTHSFGREIISR